MKPLVTLTKSVGTEQLFLDVGMDGDAIVRRTWKHGREHNKKSTKWPAASIAPAMPPERINALVHDAIADGYFISADLREGVQRTSISVMAEIPLAKSSYLEQVFEAFGCGVPDVAGVTRAAIEGSAFHLSNTTLMARLAATLLLDPSDEADTKLLDRHLAIARCISADASAYRADNTKIDIAAHLVIAIDRMSPEDAEPLYLFGIRRRPIDVSREFANGAGSDLAVGF